MLRASRVVNRWRSIRNRALVTDGRVLGRVLRHTANGGGYQPDAAGALVMLTLTCPSVKGHPSLQVHCIHVMKHDLVLRHPLGLHGGAVLC